MGGGNFIGAPQDVYYMHGDRSVSGFDVTQRFVQTVLYDLPFARNLHGFAKKALDGWQLSTIMTFQSGFPAPVTSNIDTTGTGISSRPDLVPGQRGDLPGDQRTWKAWFNTAAFAQVRLAVSELRPVPMPSACRASRTWTSRSTSRVRFKETKSLEFRSEFFNFLKNFNPGPGHGGSEQPSATFGMVGGGVQGITTRVIQLGASSSSEAEVAAIVFPCAVPRRGRPPHGWRSQLPFEEIRGRMISAQPRGVAQEAVDLVGQDQLLEVHALLA